MSSSCRTESAQSTRNRLGGRVFRLLVGLLLVLPIAAEASAAFEMRRAINIAQWFTWPRYETTGSGISWPPYREAPRPPSATDLQALRKAGFDTVRLPVDPAPFIVFEGERREDVYRMLFEAIGRVRSAQLNIVLDLHPNSRHPVWGDKAVVAGPRAPAFTAFLGVVEDMARRIGTQNADHIALELINEPRLTCQGDEQQLWQRMLAQLVQKARAANPALTLVVSGACVSLPEGLLALDPGEVAGPDLVYTFHFYEPFVFTHQGAKFIPWPEKYLDAVPWPASARPIEEPRVRLAEHVRALPGLDQASRARAISEARDKLERYYAVGADSTLIEKRFSEVEQWAKQHRIAPNRIFIGEFGVVRKTASLPGARCEDRLRWLTDVREAAERRGFAWAYFSYDGPFALVTDDQTRALDASILAGLGLRPGGKC